MVSAFSWQEGLVRWVALEIMNFMGDIFIPGFSVCWGIFLISGVPDLVDIRWPIWGFCEIYVMGRPAGDFAWNCVLIFHSRQPENPICSCFLLSLIRLRKQGLRRESICNHSILLEQFLYFVLVSLNHFICCKLWDLRCPNLKHGRLFLRIWSFLVRLELFMRVHLLDSRESRFDNIIQIMELPRMAWGAGWDLAATQSAKGRGHGFDWWIFHNLEGKGVFLGQRHQYI